MISFCKMMQKVANERKEMMSASVEGVKLWLNLDLNILFT